MSAAADDPEGSRPALPPFRDPRVVLREHGLRPKRSFGQNFLVARPVVEDIAAAVGGAPGSTVIEIGAGLGTLTAALVRSGARVVAIEPDRDMQRVLEAELGDAIERVAADAAAVSLAELAGAPGEPVLVAGNLPYQATGAIVRALVAQLASWRRAVLMVQREVAERLVAAPASEAYGALSVFVQAACRVTRVRDVSPGCFHPAPRVWSAVVALEPLEPPRAEETETFRVVVKAAFAQRRKTLRNALLATGRPAAAVDAALARAAIDGKRRGETLSVEELATLAGAWESVPGAAAAGTPARE